MILLALFWSFIQIGLFSIGGGMASLPLIQEQVVDLHGWLTLEEFTDLIAISEMTPGPIAINASTFVGMQIAGIPGAILSTLGCILPSCFIVSFLAFLYRRYQQLTAVQGILAGLRPAVVAFIANAGLTILTLALFGQTIGWPLSLSALLLFGGSLFVLRRFKPNPIAVILGCGAVGILLSFLPPPVTSSAWF